MILFLSKKRIEITSIGAKSSFSRPAVVKVVDQLELFNHSLHWNYNFSAQVEKIFPVTRIKIYPYFYDPFLPNSSRALRNFKSLCAVPVYTRNGPVTVHVIKLLLVEKFPFIVLNSPFFPYFPKFFLMTFFFFFFF